MRGSVVVDVVVGATVVVVVGATVVVDVVEAVEVDVVVDEDEVVAALARWRVADDERFPGCNLHQNTTTLRSASPRWASSTKPVAAATEGKP